MNLSAVILAGGRSRRMGRDKAWIELDGQPLIARAVDTARNLRVKEIFISGRDGQDYSALNCPVLRDFEPGFGPVSGIERALEAAGSPLLLVMAVDLPYLTSDYLRRLFMSCDRLTGAVPELNGRLEPLAAIYPKRCQEFARDLMARFRHAACEFAETCRLENAVRTVRVGWNDAGCFTNWNRPADVAVSMATV